MAVRRAIALLPVVTMVAPGWLAGCAAKPTPPRAETPGTSQVTTAAGTTPPPPPSRTTRWTALQAGDCLQGLPPTDPALVTVTLVDCSQPHRAEVYLRAGIPVNTAVSETANTLCENGFAKYTGSSVAASPYSTVYLIDSEQDRTENNPYPSSVICLLQEAGGQWLTGSARI